MCAAKPATSTQATKPADAANVLAAVTYPAEPAEAAVAEAGAAELARRAGLTCGRLGGSDALSTWTHHFDPCVT